MSTKREQKLVDICFAVGIMLHDHPNLQYMTREEVGEWIAKQLKDNGFPTKPVGMSWGVL